ncbi:hypothetical protein ABT063_51800 [Streptomyces sp. NPDC002838]|uniref:hypothetical protein n=1 Tax=Streptomyces sp. NPDC002838 TaxID=3154436 RepID=UPI003323705B
MRYLYPALPPVTARRAGVTAMAAGERPGLSPVRTPYPVLAAFTFNTAENGGLLTTLWHGAPPSGSGMTA